MHSVSVKYYFFSVPWPEVSLDTGIYRSCLFGSSSIDKSELSKLLACRWVKDFLRQC